MKSLTPEQAAIALRSGDLIAYPTEGVYGLGCDPFNEAAVMRLLALKGRPVEKGLILVAAERAQIEALVSLDAVPTKAQILAGWPGPVTWTLPATERVPVWIRGRFDTVAVRVSAHPVVQRLCRAFGGPLVSTSANPAGKPPALSCDQVADYFPDQLAGCVTGELGGQSGPTPIFDARTGQALRGG